MKLDSFQSGQERLELEKNGGDVDTNTSGRVGGPGGYVGGQVETKVVEGIGSAETTEAATI